MKICLYLEFFHFAGGILFKNIGTGLLSSYRNQKRMLAHMGIAFTERWDPSCDILQINTPWLRSLYLMKKARRMGMGVIVWAHVTVEDAMQVFRFMPMIAPLLKRYLTYAYNSADIIFCPTAYTASLLRSYGIPEEKCIVQSNAVDTDFFRPSPEKRMTGRRRYGIRPDAFVVGTVGLVIPRKGIDTFLDLARRFPDCTWYWFGKMYSRVLVASLPADLPPNVRFVGYVDDIREAYALMDVFLFPSYEENQGMAILEAAAMGIPVVVRDIPVYTGWLVHEKNCLKAKDTQRFETAIRELREHRALRGLLSTAGVELAKKESIETLSKNLQDTYARLLRHSQKNG